MEDHETSTSTPTANVQLFFTGLFVFCFTEPCPSGDIKARSYTQRESKPECRTGVVSTAPGHSLKITVYKISPSGTSVRSIAFNHPDESRLLESIRLDTSRDASGVSCRKFGPDFDRKTAQHETDIRWVVDFESGEFHDRPIDVNPDILLPIIHIKTGEFYTAKRTPEDFNRIQGSTIMENFGHVAEYVGVDIQLGSGECFSLKLGGMTFIPPTTVAADERYGIFFENSRVDHNSHKTQLELLSLEIQQSDNETIATAAQAVDSDAIFKVVDFPPMTLRKKEGGAFEVSFESPSPAPQIAHHNSALASDNHEVELPTDIQFYYHALNVPATEYFDLKPLTLRAKDKRGARPAICYPKMLGQTTILPSASDSGEPAGKTKKHPKSRTRRGRA